MPEKQPQKSSQKPKKEPVHRTRSVLVCFWLSQKEEAALREAEEMLTARTGESRQRSKRLRGMVAKFVSEVRMARDFEG